MRVEINTYKYEVYDLNKLFLTQTSVQSNKI